MGSSNVKHDLEFYQDVIGAKLIWHSKHFGAEVAAVSFGEEQPLLLLADHIKPPKCELIYEVQDIDLTFRDLESRGFRAEGEKFEIPNGPCYLFKDPSGNTLAIFEDVRPDVMPGARE
jgi:predicted enzyme related to lactoylglutathione lyase